MSKTIFSTCAALTALLISAASVARPQQGLIVHKALSLDMAMAQGSLAKCEACLPGNTRMQRGAAESGECNPWSCFAVSLDGHLRAYDSAIGGIIWDFDMLQQFPAVNGIQAHGGSINGSGPVIAGGMLFCNSDYARLSVMAGIVLLAFVVEDK
jgi:polyvinyl alcohol dehydrogenase (cytochrome)